MREAEEGVTVAARLGVEERKTRDDGTVANP